VHFSQVSSLRQQIDAQNKTIAKLERKVKSLDDTVDTLNGYVMQLQEKMDEVY
jgi:peptidoglycan hydrolase CwlO-like protein